MSKDAPTNLIEQIDTLLYLNKSGSLSTPLPGLARELLTKSREGLSELAGAAEALLHTTPEERREPSIWFARVDRLRRATSQLSRPESK